MHIGRFCHQQFGSFKLYIYMYIIILSVSTQYVYLVMSFLLHVPVFLYCGLIVFWDIQPNKRCIMCYSAWSPSLYKPDIISYLSEKSLTSEGSWNSCSPHWKLSGHTHTPTSMCVCVRGGGLLLFRQRALMALWVSLWVSSVLSYIHYLHTGVCDDCSADTNLSESVSWLSRLLQVCRFLSRGRRNVDTGTLFSSSSSIPLPGCVCIYRWWKLSWEGISKHW